jgi:predicted transcriptional regulator YdeE
MSKFKNYSEKNLKFLLRRIRQDIDPFENGRNLITSSTEQAINNILDDIGISSNNDDLSFIFALYRLNPNFEVETLKIPELHTYEVITKRQARITVVELWKSEVESYFDDENDVQQFGEWFGGSGSDWWEGDMIDRDEYDEETTDVEIDEINKLS